MKTIDDLMYELELELDDEAHEAELDYEDDDFAYSATQSGGDPVPLDVEARLFSRGYILESESL